MIVSGAERCEEPRQLLLNGLACFTLRGDLRKSEVRLDNADGFSSVTACQCDFLYAIPKSILHSNIGTVAWERQQQIKSKIKEVFRFH